MLILRGTRVLGMVEVSGERALLAAVVRQALKDAEHGNGEAVEWLDQVAPWWCGKLLDLDPARVSGWRGVIGGVMVGGSRRAYRWRATQSPAPSAAERSRQYRERKAATQVAEVGTP